MRIGFSPPRYPGGASFNGMRSLVETNDREIMKMMLIMQWTIIDKCVGKFLCSFSMRLQLRSGTCRPGDAIAFPIDALQHCLPSHCASVFCSSIISSREAEIRVEFDTLGVMKPLPVSHQKYLLVEDPMAYIAPSQGNP